MEKDKKKKKFNLYDFFNGTGNNNESKGDKPDEPRNFSYFFKLLGRKISTLLNVNIMLVLGNFPVFFLLLARSGLVSAQGTAQQSTLFAPLYGAMQLSGTSPASAALFGIHGAQVTVNVNTTLTYIIYGIGALTLLTFGPVNCAISYIMRNIVKGDPLFLLDDFKSTIKKNWRTGIFLGILDLLFAFVIAYDVLIFYQNIGSFFSSICFYFSLFVLLLYLFVRMYMYVIAVTFKLSIFKIIKNSLIFAFLGMKRNFLGLIGIVLVLFLNYELMAIYMPLGIIMPFVLTLGIIYFIMVYVSWPKIKQLMVDPFYNPDGTPKEAPQQ